MEEFYICRLSFCNKGRELNSLTQTSEYFFSSIYLSHETTLKNIPRLHVLVFIYFFYIGTTFHLNLNKVWKILWIKCNNFEKHSKITCWLFNCFFFTGTIYLWYDWIINTISKYMFSLRMIIKHKVSSWILT